jgi:hypothetical protein
MKIKMVFEEEGRGNIFSPHSINTLGTKASLNG